MSSRSTEQDFVLKWNARYQKRNDLFIRSFELCNGEVVSGGFERKEDKGQNEIKLWWN